MEGDIEQQTAGRRMRSSPAVGLHVTPDADPDAVAGAVLRARRHGHDVFVIGAVDADREVAAVIDQLEPEVVETDHTSNGTHPRELLASSARSAGYPGVLWQATPSTRIDFQRSVDELRTASEYCLEARTEPAVTPEPHVLVAIPAYNEARTIADVVAGALPHADEVLVVDDGSEDETVARAREAGATVIEHERNRGYGSALKTAFQEANRSRADHLVVLDGDGQHDPDDIPTLVRTQQKTEAELVIGSRFTPDAETEIPLYRRVGLAVVNWLTNVSMGIVRPSSGVRDTQCGFRVYDRELASSLATEASIGSNMGASTDILHHARAKGCEIAEAPTSVDYDVENASTHTPVQHGITLIMNLVRTVEQERPISSIGIPGFLFTLLGIGFGYWTFYNFISTGTFPIGSAVTASFFGLVGIFACFTAIILHSLNQHLDK